MSGIDALLRSLEAPGIDERWNAARSLAARGEDAVDALIRILYHDDPQVRLLAAWALGNAGSERAVPYLERMLEDEDPCAQLAVECALQRIRRAGSQRK